MKQTLTNGKTIMNYDPDAKAAYDVIDGKDLTDRWNEPACYAKTKQSHKKAWKALTEQWSESTTMYEACRILDNNGIRMHTYCAMD